MLVLWALHSPQNMVRKEPPSAVRPLISSLERPGHVVCLQLGLELSQKPPFCCCLSV